MFAPEPQLAACLEVLFRAAVDARMLGYKGEQDGLSREDSAKLTALMDAVHELPRLAADWERCDEQLLREILGDYDARYGGGLLDSYERTLAAYSRTR